MIVTMAVIFLVDSQTRQNVDIGVILSLTTGNLLPPESLAKAKQDQ